MSEPKSSGIKEDENVALEYNTNNVKKAKLNSTLAALLDDPVLADVPKKPSLSDVDTLISLELGSAMRVTVLKLDGTSFDVAVMNNATVKDLKLAVKKKVNEMEQSKMGHRHISWFSLNFIIDRVRMSEPKSSGVKEDENVALEYNTNNVKKAKLNSTLAALLDDPVLADVPKKPTLSDVDTLISLELGSAMRVTVLKLDNTSFDVAVMNNATVKDLKLAVKKKVNEMEQSKMGHRHISWKHVWRNFCLSHHNEKLLNDDANLQDHDVRNHSQVHFIPYVMSRASKQHSRRRKHRFFHGLNRRE